MTINIPNILTVIRILLTPLFVIFLLRNLFSFALLVFTIAAISDALDGLFARYFNQHTALGAYLDPIADKLLLTSAFVSLAILKIVPGWLTVIVISRDILILL
ncbi:MAG: CDP-alcohol phosphatidyltransferase family protein, partial [Thermodesulfobacteriota bacterium]|nr:CDP-alcohol phosphatidyltransferase family protein [Thermodesulfobacteriota bacterium]